MSNFRVVRDPTSDSARHHVGSQTVGDFPPATGDSAEVNARPLIGDYHRSCMLCRPERLSGTASLKRDLAAHRVVVVDGQSGLS
jgi:hypothetical protein